MSSTSSPNVFLDTNVLVEYFLGRKHSRDCARLLNSLWAQNLRPAISPTSLKDLFYLVESTLKRNAREDDPEWSGQDEKAMRVAAWACVQRTLEFARVARVSWLECHRAFDLKTLHGDFEDDQVIACAELDGADYFVTFDTDLAKHAPLPCFTPAEMADILEA